jgi:tRNA 5-methylaminomethyl-2-thiouridine biosynthesis bifunctional protein
VQNQQASAKIRFNEQGFPYSEQFDDIYFDDSQGYQQSEEVFLQGNNLPSAWENYENTCFTIAETGFGTGLNFFLTLKALAAFNQNGKAIKLHFISVEKYPMSEAQIKQSLAAWPELQPFINEFCQHYKPENTSSLICHLLGGQVKLTLIFADAQKGLAQLPPKSVNAWYLDGFAPKKNPQMWNTGLYKQMARLAASNCSMATFTVAGHVRRGLMDAGFSADKKTSQGKKEQILVGRYLGDDFQKPKQGFKLRPLTNKPQHVTLVGGGLASACLAYYLTKEKIKVTLLCQDDAPAQGASSNAIGAVYPLIHREKDKISRFYQQAFNHATALYQQLASAGYQFSHDFSGLLEVAHNEPLKKRLLAFSQNSPWPPELLQVLNSQQASDKAGVKLNSGGLFFPFAGWVCPPELVKALLKACSDTGLLEIKYQVNITNISKAADNRWQLFGNNNGKAFQHRAKVVALCCGADGMNLKALADLPLSPVRGQVTQMASTPDSSKLKTVLCHKGYLTPENHGIHCIGATFDKDDGSTDIRDQDNRFNLKMLNHCLPELDFWQERDIKGANARVRCCTPDHMPIAGALPDIEGHKAYYWKLAKDKNLAYQQVAPCVEGLYVLTGLGARGLCSAPLLGQILSNEICNKPYPLDWQMMFALAPNRFVIKDLIRGLTPQSQAVF